MILATEFFVDSFGFVFPSDKIVVADAKDAAYVACFGEDCCDVFLSLQNCLADYVLVGFEFGWDVELRLMSPIMSKAWGTLASKSAGSLSWRAWVRVSGGSLFFAKNSG